MASHAFSQGKGAFVRLKEDSTTVVFILANVAEQEALLAAKAKVYFITGHYRGYGAVLARLAALSARECRARLLDGFRLKAPKKVAAAYEAKLVGKKKAPRDSA